MMDKRKIQSILLQAQKDNERNVTGIIGKTDDADETTIYSNAEKTEVWVRINGMAEPYSALIGDPAAIVPLARVYLRYDVEASRWVIVSVNASANTYYFQNVGGFSFSTQVHNHTSAQTGGTLGDNTVDTTQIVDDAVTQAKIDALAVDTTELADGAVTSAKLDTDSVDATHINNLTLATLGRLRQEASNTFSTIKDNLTATTDPATGDDDLDGYVVLSFWLNTTTPELFFCADNSTGAANWVSLTESSTVPDHTHDGTAGSGGLLPNDTITRAMMSDDSVGADEVWGLTASVNAYITQNSGGSFASLKYNTTGIDPTAGDDSADGYSQRSYWFNTADRKWFLCWSNTAGAAVWTQITGDDHIATADIQDDAIIPTKLNGLSGATTAIVAQTASNVFTTIPYTLTTDTRLFYDGTNIRSAYTDSYTPNTTDVTVNSTSFTDVIEITIANTDMSNTSYITVGFEPLYYGTVVGDNFVFRLLYYNGSGYTEVPNIRKQFSTLVSGAFTNTRFSWSIDQPSLATAPDVDGSNNYLWKVQCTRGSGSGNLIIKLNYRTTIDIEEK